MSGTVSPTDAQAFLLRLVRTDVTGIVVYFGMVAVSKYGGTTYARCGTLVEHSCNTA